MKRIAIILSIFAFAVYSCELDDPEIKYAVTYPISGEWWVTYKFDDGTGAIDDWYGVGYTRLLTTNTASNTADSIWVSDGGNFWSFQVKATIDLKARTFSVNNGVDIIFDDATTITNGKVIERADGDSIYLNLVWASDPTTTYICSGRRVKGFLNNGGTTSYDADYGK